MIIFKKLRYKNFLSTGNKFTEIDFIKDKTTLVVGHNGSGKSTMLDALSFALFGKSHRNINKPQLVNSINQKHTHVEVEFSVSGNNFKVVRGLKPIKFEIWKDKTMINQNSHAKEYQKILEQNILKLNHKSFHQIVVLGSSSFVPFMQLSSLNRREVIEDLLDINVFSKMNQILKEKNSGLRESIVANEHAIDLVKTKIESHKRYIRDVTKINKEYRSEKEGEIKKQTTELFELQKQNKELLDYVTLHEPQLKNDQAELTKKMGKLNKYESELKTRLKNLSKDAKFFKENDTCPSCEQGIPDEVRENKVGESIKSAQEIEQALVQLDSHAAEVDKNQTSIGEQLTEIHEKQMEVHANNQTISRLQSSIESKEGELKNLDADGSDISKANAEMKELDDEYKTAQEEKLTLNEQFQYNQVVLEMLKDTGIKTKIIKQYIPVINQLVNQYLQVLDFFVHFELDEAFNETIKSRHRDAFSYDSFSEGEKQRIDLSLLFTWRQVAKMKNSVATNLLILDETFDSSLDQDGVENLMKILYTLGDETNVFVISHKGDILEGKFQSKIEFTKEKNFSRIK